MQTIKTFIKDHPHMWWGLYLPVYLGGFFLIEHFITDNYWATQTYSQKGMYSSIKVWVAQ